MEPKALTGTLSDLLAIEGPRSHAARLVEGVVDEFLALPMGDLVDRDTLGEYLIAALQSEGPTLNLERHWDAMVQAERERAHTSGEALREAVPEEVIAGIEERLSRPMGLPVGFGKEVVDPVFVRELIAASLTETLEAFLTRLPFGGGKGGNGGVLGSLARKGAGRIKSATSTLSSIGAGVQEGLKRQAKEFAQQSADRLKEGVVDRFKGEESREALKRMRQRALAAVVDLPMSDVHALADDPGWVTLRQWTQTLLAHNMARPEVQDAIRAQVALAVDRIKDQTLADWLHEYSIYEPVRKELTLAGVTVVNRMVTTPRFQGWLVELLSDALQ